ncbi:SpoIIE family protein phosphatase [Kitasatospora sp. DSM 101779]|uniref:SpoIIE family protein phosphatase n=1 Tax=Kitasatospora sp. DSM 101779 TaxID=2853165 RepID=UPI0021DAC82F|nr:SpoIIE family protein phosphatase [Kitasatospora sp. DSM 101779]MCU7826160.1 SpoIIE family protein phosphatase [Kitasatospora sp. DSM 101779]
MRLGVPADGEPGAAAEHPDAPAESDAPTSPPATADPDPPPTGQDTSARRSAPGTAAPGPPVEDGPDTPPPPADAQPPPFDRFAPPGAPPGAADRDAVEKLLAEGLTRAVDLTSGYGGLVYLPSPDHRSLVLSTVVGVPLPLLSAFRRIAVPAPLPPAEAFRSGRTIVLADPDETMRRFPRLAVGLPYAFSFAAAPIATRAGTLGVLCVLWPSTEAGLPGGARRQLRSSANRIAASLAPYGELAATDEPTVVQLPPPSGPATRVGVFDWDIPGRAIAVDQELEAILGLAPGSFDGRLATLVERLSPEDMPLLREAARRAAADGRPFDRQVRVRDPRGGHRTLDLRGRPVADGTHLVVVVLDDSAGSAAVAAVERLRDGVFALDAEGMVVYVNRTAEMFLQARRDELLGRHPWRVLPWLGDPAYEDRYRAAMLSRRPTAFLACRPPDHWLAFSLYPDAHGVTGRVVAAAEPADPHTAVLPEAPPAAPASLGATYHLLQLASALTEAVSVQEVCNTVLEQILPGYGGQELALYLAQNGRMHLVSQSGYPEGFLDRFEATPLGARLPGTETLIAGTPLFFQSSRELLDAYPGIPQDEMRAWAFLPLIASGHPIGSLILGFEQARTFTPEDRVQLTALGGLIAQALERARLYDAEFELARGLQQALLPHRLPTVPGIAITARYLPGTRGMEIGGDWYDVITTPHGLCLVIGDVEGHNVGAAATMGQLRSAVRAFASGGSPPAEVLVRTNHLMVDLDPGLLASCCLIHLDPSDGRGHGVRAGHPPPLLRRPDGRTDLVDLEGGPLLGVDRSSYYPTTRLHLPVGSVLALYTDGLVESPSTAIDQGIDELRSSLAHAGPVVPAASAARGGEPDGDGRSGGARTLDGLADRLVGRARRTAQRLDDIALLLVRRE